MSHLIGEGKSKIDTSTVVVVVVVVSAVVEHTVELNLAEKPSGQ